MSRPKDYFTIQVIYAKKFAQLNHESFRKTIFRNVAFYKLFGLRGSKLKQQHPIWQAYLDLIKDKDDVQQLIEITYEYYLQINQEKNVHKILIAEPNQYCCFSYKVDDAKQKIDLHFTNNETNGRSPLDAFNIIRRKNELKNLIQNVRSKYPEKQIIYCRTWLLNTNNFKFLFPKPFIQNIKSSYWRTDSSAMWGQFIDYQGKVKSDIANQFINSVNQARNLDQLKKCFKLPVLESQCSISDFN